MFTCTVCCKDQRLSLRNKSNKLTCPRCHFECCVRCQTRFARNECMSCHMVFTLEFTRNVLGTLFVKNVLKPNKIAELMREQRQTLPKANVLVEWEREVRKQKDLARFGIMHTVPQRPSLLSQTTDIFPCPVDHCRGFVESNNCKVCRIHVCMSCQKIILSEPHTCNLSDIQCIAEIRKTTKPCPKCTAFIHKTQGCDHMICTNCKTRFDWKTGQIQTRNSNMHYQGLDTFKNAVVKRETLGDNDECSTTHVHRQHFTCPLTTPNDLKRSLWTDYIAIMSLKNELYDETKLNTTLEARLVDLQVLYLIGDIDEAKWANRVYASHVKHEISTLYSHILDVYLGTSHYLRHRLCKEKQPDFCSIRHEYTQLVCLCNHSFESVQKEYLGALHRIRTPEDHKDVPSIMT